MKRLFTLLEMLIVVAIIAILLSILMPNVYKTRQKAKQALCMSNTRQLAAAGSRYVINNNSRYWTWITTSGFRPYWQAGKKGAWGPHPENRPLNAYLDIDNQTKESPVTQCPSDEYLRPGFNKSAYDYFGTSYCDGTGGNSLSKRGGNALKTLGGSNNIPGIPASYVVDNSRMIMIMEWNVISNGYRPNENFDGWHGYKTTTASFCDGSAGYVQILIRQIHGEDFTLEYDHTY